MKTKKILSILLTCVLAVTLLPALRPGAQAETDGGSFEPDDMATASSIPITGAAMSGIPVTGITLNKSTITSLPVINIETLTATVHPASAANKAVVWSSSDEDIATVTGGRVTAVAEGMATITSVTVDGGFTASCAVTVTKRNRGIDYEGVTSVTANGSEAGFEIDLSEETVTIPATYTSMAYSIDGGQKWKTGAFNPAMLSKLLNKDLTLHLSNTAIDKETKQPGEGAVIVTFPKIHKRPKAPSLSVNYEIGADASGDNPGDWLLTVKGGSLTVKHDILIGLASGKGVDSNGYGCFFEGTGNGIPVTSKKATYIIKTAPTQSGGVYTAAGKPKKVNVSGAPKAPNAKVAAKHEKKNTDGTVKTPAAVILKIKRNTYVKIGDGAPQLYKNKAGLDILGFTGTIELWTAETEKKPAGAKQVITR